MWEEGWSSGHQLGDLTQETRASLGGVILGTRMQCSCPGQGPPEAMSSKSQAQPPGCGNRGGPGAGGQQCAPRHLHRPATTALCCPSSSGFRALNILDQAAGSARCSVSRADVSRDGGPSRMRRAVGPFGLGPEGWEDHFSIRRGEKRTSQAKPNCLCGFKR